MKTLRSTLNDEGSSLWGIEKMEIFSDGLSSLYVSDSITNLFNR